MANFQIIFLKYLFLKKKKSKYDVKIYMILIVAYV